MVDWQRCYNREAIGRVLIGFLDDYVKRGAVPCLSKYLNQIESVYVPQAGVAVADDPEEKDEEVQG